MIHTMLTILWTILKIYFWLDVLAAVVLAWITYKTVKLPIFWLIQFISISLTPPGWIICLCPPLAKLLWIFWNDDDGAVGATWWKRYVWLAWRNPVDNWKHVKWTQRPGPLVYKPFQWRGQQYYYKAGWMSDSYCALSAGQGKGF